MSLFRRFIAGLKRIRLRAAERLRIGESVQAAVRKEAQDRLTLAMEERDFFASATRISLSPAEKVAGREALLLHTRRSPAHAWWLLPFKSLASVTASVLIVTTVAGVGIGYAAENAMPGDLLYPVKVHVNEEVRSALASSPTERAKIENERAERRLREAEMLAERSALDEETASMLAKNMRTNVERVRSVAHDMMQTESGAVAAAAIGMDTEALLRAHGKLLRYLAEKDGTPSHTIVAAVENLRMDVEESNVTALLLGNPSLVAASLRRDLHEGDENARENSARVAMFAAEAKVEDDHDLDDVRKTLRTMKEDALQREHPDMRFALREESESDHPVMLLAVPTPKRAEPSPKEETGSLLLEGGKDHMDEDEREELNFATKVRVRMTEKKVRAVEDLLKETQSDASDDVVRPPRERMEGAKKMIEEAKKKMEDGEAKEALKKSEEALKHADETNRELEKMLRDRR